LIVDRISKPVLKLLAIFLLLQSQYGAVQEIPHKALRRDCNKCHSTKEWHQIKFDHSVTHFELQGQHRFQQCTSCHSLEDFSLAQSECSSCHTDVHQGKMPYECTQCHTPEGWFVLDIYRVHANTTFPVMGAHSRLDCDACHLPGLSCHVFLASGNLFGSRFYFSHFQRNTCWRMGHLSGLSYQRRELSRI